MHQRGEDGGQPAVARPRPRPRPSLPAARPGSRAARPGSRAARPGSQASERTAAPTETSSVAAAARGPGEESGAAVTTGARGEMESMQRKLAALTGQAEASSSSSYTVPSWLAPMQNRLSDSGPVLPTAGALAQATGAPQLSRGHVGSSRRPGKKQPAIEPDVRARKRGDIASDISLWSKDGLIVHPPHQLEAVARSLESLNGQQLGPEPGRGLGPPQPIAGGLKSSSGWSKVDKTRSLLKVAKFVQGQDAPQAPPTDKQRVDDVQCSIKVSFGGETYDVNQLCAKVPILQNLGLDDQKVIAAALRKIHAVDRQPLVVAGEVGHTMYFLVKGAAQAEVDGVGVVKHYAPGSFFGELALMHSLAEDGGSSRRTATVRAVGAPGADCLELDGKVFRNVMAANGHTAAAAASAAAEAKGGKYVMSKEASHYLIKQLTEFQNSDKAELRIYDTSSEDRKMAHRWIDEHEDETVRRWGHISRTLRRQRILHITREKNDWTLDLDKWLLQEAQYRREDEGEDYDPVGSFSWGLVIRTNWEPAENLVIFESYDADGSGNIDEEELYRLCRDLGVNDANPFELMAEIDRKNVGEVNFVDVHHWWMGEGKNRSRNPTIRLRSRFSNLHEAHHICTRLWDRGMAVRHEIASSGKYMFIKVGAKDSILQDEAEEMKLSMRLQHTKGHMPFQRQFSDHFATSADGTCFNSAQRQQLVKNRMDRCLVVPAESRIQLESAENTLKKFREKLDRHETIRWTILQQLFTTCGAYRSDCSVTIGPHTHRAVKLTEWDKYIEVEYSTEQVHHEHMHEGGGQLNHMLQATEEIMDDAAQLALQTTKDAMKQTRKVAEFSADVMATIVGIDRNSTKKLASKKYMRRMKAERYKAAGEQQLTFLGLEKIYTELIRWFNRAGVDEKYVGTLERVFPMHDAAELAFFQGKWARMWPVTCNPVSDTCSWRCNPTCKLGVLAKANEGKGTKEAYYTGIEVLPNMATLHRKEPGWLGRHFKFMHPTEETVSVHLFEDSWKSDGTAYTIPAVAEFGQTTPTSWYNTPERQWAYCYQPIDEIRDYFGDSVGLYFRWLGLFVSSLVTPAVAGALITFFNITQQGDEVEQLADEALSVEPEMYRSQGGAPNNKLSAAYSVYFAFWTVQFLSKWERTENEYQFLWGSGDTHISERPRMSYRGIIRMNLAGKEKLVDRNPRRQNLIRLGSWVLIMLMILLTIVVAIVCANLEKIAPPAETIACIAGGSSGVSNESCVIGDWQDRGCAEKRTICSPERASSYCEAAANSSCTFIHTVVEMDSFGTFWEYYKWVIASAMANLTWMVFMEAVFKKLAVRLNERENHMLQSTFDNNLILKNFVFQFVNNYFVLFYIAYLRHYSLDRVVEYVPILTWFPQALFESVQCPQSCLGVLQIKMLIIFTGKTWGQKLNHVMLIFLKTRLSAWKLDQMAFIAPEFDENGKAIKRKRNRTNRSEDVDPLSLERQMMKPMYAGNVEEFQPVVIQFGYLALFACTCPIAPLLALIYGTTEIRVNAAKLCYLVQRPQWTPCATIGAWKTVLAAVSVIAVATNATMICFVSSVMADPDVPAQKETIMVRLGSVRLWVYAVLIEHSIGLLLFALETIAPTVPQWVKEARETLEDTKIKMKAGDELDREGVAGTSEVEDIADLFSELDGDGSGTLDHSEVEVLCTRLGLSLGRSGVVDITSVMSEMDHDGNGEVTLAEFLAWWKTNGKKNAFQLRDVKKIFAQVDVNGDGGLDLAELHRMCKGLGMKNLTEADLEDLMAELDTDRSGLVDFAEFEAWWRSHGGKEYRSSTVVSHVNAFGMEEARKTAMSKVRTVAAANSAANAFHDGSYHTDSAIVSSKEAYDIEVSNPLANRPNMGPTTPPRPAPKPSRTR